MIRFIRDLRIIPIALIASACLLALKAADLALDGSAWLVGDNRPANDTGASIIRTTPDAPQPPGARLSWAQQMLGFPNGSGSTPSADIAPLPNASRLYAQAADQDITGSVTEPSANKADDTAKKPDAKDSNEKNPKDAKNPKDQKAGNKIAPPPPVDGTVIPTDGVAAPSGAERAILERLQQRREELDKRARELDIRENLIKAEEKRMEGRLTELKETEGQIATNTQKKSAADAERLKGLVTMYENMKPRDAAKIFDRLDPDVLLEVVSLINPRKMSDIMAQMSPDAAERLTVELASRGQSVDKGSPGELPKIEGKPTQ